MMVRGRSVSHVMSTASLQHTRIRATVVALAAAIAAAMVAAGSPASAAGAPSESGVEASANIPVLRRAEFDALLARRAEVLVIDVRRADEISAIGGFPAYLSVPLSELDRFLATIPRDRQLITVSNHAARAKRAADRLAREGFRVAGAVGAQDYEAEGGFLSGATKYAPAIPGVVAADTRIDVLREGLEGTEGPVALADGSIVFTENRADRLVRIAPDGSVSTWATGTQGANALAVNAGGELLAVQTAPAAIGVVYPESARRVLVARVGKQPLNRPNDLALARRGDVYFTDPGPALQLGQPVGPTAVYHADPQGRVRVIATDIRRPNGIALSPDERTLYVANTAGDTLVAFDVADDGRVSGRRDFGKLAGLRETPTGPSSGADGIAVDAEGRVFVATTAGVQVFTPAGDALGVIPLPRPPQNLAFGGPKREHLYVVGRGAAWRIPTLTHGPDRPGK
jgi:gluconolactonase